MHRRSPAPGIHADPNGHQTLARSLCLNMSGSSKVLASSGYSPSHQHSRIKTRRVLSRVVFLLRRLLALVKYILFSLRLRMINKSALAASFCFGVVTMAILRLRAHSRKTFVHMNVEKSPKVLVGKDKEKVSLTGLVEKECPAVFSKFNPVWWTMYCVAGNFKQIDKVTYDRVYLRTLDGGTLGLDFAPLDWASRDDETPIVVMSHGLTGGSHEAYVRAVATPVIAPVEKGGLGYRAVVVNFRGCAGVPITSGMLYSAGHTDDLRLALIYIQNRFPKAPLMGIGFSLGANIMSRYVAEEGTASRLRSGCAVGCPWNLSANNQGLKSSWIGNNLYSKAMGKNLQKLAKRHYKSLLRHANPVVIEACEKVVALKDPTIEEFDDILTVVAGGPAPRWPYATAEDYYQDNSASKLLGQIRVPFLGLNAADDPIVRDLSIVNCENPWTIMAMTPGGGHLGWFEAPLASNPKQPSRWFTKPILEWFKRDNVAGKIVEDEEGWLRDAERPGIAVRELEDHAGLVSEDKEDPKLRVTQGL
ncbi:AB-hydrolase YheT [Flagelloscypha sp. PMI_526]|nr:AB-hydrolase YheT [Flagelloscypha sp. PMI_526]